MQTLLRASHTSLQAMGFTERAFSKSNNGDMVYIKTGYTESRRINTVCTG